MYDDTPGAPARVGRQRESDSAEPRKEACNHARGEWRERPRPYANRKIGPDKGHDTRYEHYRARDGCDPAHPGRHDSVLRVGCARVRPSVAEPQRGDKKRCDNVYHEPSIERYVVVVETVPM